MHRLPNVPNTTRIRHPSNDRSAAVSQIPSRTTSRRRHAGRAPIPPRDIRQTRSPHPLRIALASATLPQEGSTRFQILRSKK